MSDTLIKALIALVPLAVLLAWAVTSYARNASIWRFARVLGAACLVVVVLTHVAEALQLFPGMRWGSPASPGHYLDLSSAVLGLTLLPAGFLGARRGR